jgi:hypothetical protein
MGTHHDSVSMSKLLRLRKHLTIDLHSKSREVLWVRLDDCFTLILVVGYNTVRCSDTNTIKNNVWRLTSTSFIEFTKRVVTTFERVSKLATHGRICVDIGELRNHFNHLIAFSFGCCCQFLFRKKSFEFKLLLFHSGHGFCLFLQFSFHFLICN